LNNSGWRDPGEPGIVNSKVYLDGGDFEPGIGDKLVYTDKDGNFSFTGLKPATYNVMHISNNGYFSISPAFGIAVVQVTANAGVSNLEFGDSNHVLGGFGAVIGRVFNDLNGDGGYDPNEPGIAGRTMFIDLDKDGVLGGDDLSAQSGADGRYEIVHVPSGQTRMVEVVPAGWVATTDATQVLNLLPGYMLIRNFGTRSVGGAIAEEPAVSPSLAATASDSSSSGEESLLSSDNDEILA
jgi:hypothetical protein